MNSRKDTVSGVSTDSMEVRDYIVQRGTKGSAFAAIVSVKNNKFD